MESSLLKKFNDQINMEYYSAFLYLAMSEWLQQNDYVGAGHWMFVQYWEEIVHAEGFYRYLQYRGLPIELEAIEKPKKEWDSILQVFQEALAHEKLITKAISEMADEAQRVGDRAALLFLDWYILEQVEEEANQTDNVMGVERCKGHIGALLSFDNQMGRREYTREEIPGID